MDEKKPAEQSSNDSKNQPNSELTPKDKNQEQGGVDRLEPTRYGDWEKGGRCIDF